MVFSAGTGLLSSLSKKPQVFYTVTKLLSQSGCEVSVWLLQSSSKTTFSAGDFFSFELGLSLDT
jgi:hypothetical protein